MRHPRHPPAGRLAEAAAVVVDQVPVDAELKRMRVDLVGAEERIPVNVPLPQEAEHVPADIGDPRALAVLPLVAAAPVAGELQPELRGRRAERGVRLGIAVVLVAAHRNQRVLIQLLPQKRDHRGDRERVAVDEHEHVVGLGRVRHEVPQESQLALVLLHLHVGGVKELRGVVHHRVVQPRVNAVRLVDIAVEIGELDVDPVVVRPMDGRDVDHRTAEVIPGPGLRCSRGGP